MGAGGEGSEGGDWGIGAGLNCTSKSRLGVVVVAVVVVAEEVEEGMASASGSALVTVTRRESKEVARRRSKCASVDKESRATEGSEKGVVIPTPWRPILNRMP